MCCLPLYQRCQLYVYLTDLCVGIIFWGHFIMVYWNYCQYYWKNRDLFPDGFLPAWLSSEVHEAFNGQNQTFNTLVQSYCVCLSRGNYSNTELLQSSYRVIFSLKLNKVWISFSFMYGIWYLVFYTSNFFNYISFFGLIIYVSIHMQVQILVPNTFP